MSDIPRMYHGDLRLILAMREPYLSQLLSGEKTVEVRRTRPTNRVLWQACSLRLYLYKGGYIHGFVDVKRINELDEIKSLCNWQDVCKAACLTDQEMEQYLEGADKNRVALYEVGNPSRYKKPHKFGTIVQSWIYADQDFIHRADSWEVEA